MFSVAGLHTSNVLTSKVARNTILIFFNINMQLSFYNNKTILIIYWKEVIIKIEAQLHHAFRMKWLRSYDISKK